MTDTNKGTLLVTGGTGKLGAAVIDALLDDHALDPARLIVTTRTPQRLAALAERGVAVRAADFDATDSLQSAFEGADVLLLISVADVGRRTEQHSNAIAAAEAAGVGHVIYTSMPEPDGSPIVFAPEHAGTERRLRESSIPAWTVLRNNWYFENLAELQSSILESGVWPTLTGKGRVAQISRLDLAQAAAAALMKAGSEKRTLTLHGAEALTVPEMAEQIGAALGGTIEVVTMDESAFRQSLAGAGLPGPIVEMMTSFEQHNDANLSAGSPDDYHALTGATPRSFKTWLGEQREALAALRKG